MKKKKIKKERKPFDPVHWPYDVSAAETLIVQYICKRLDCSNVSEIFEHIVIFFMNNARKKDLKNIYLIELKKDNILKICINMRVHFQDRMIKAAERLNIASHQELVRYAIWYAQQNNFIYTF